MAIYIEHSPARHYLSLSARYRVLSATSALWPKDLKQLHIYYLLVSKVLEGPQVLRVKGQIVAQTTDRRHDLR